MALEPMGVGSTSSSAEDREISFTPLSLSTDFELEGEVYCVGGGGGNRDNINKFYFFLVCLSTPISSYTKSRKLWQALNNNYDKKNLLPLCM